MREKKWVDCPACGAKVSMRYRTRLAEQFEPSGYRPIDIKGLSGYFCQSCGEGFWSIKSEGKISRELARNMAEQDSKRVVAADMVSVRDAARIMHVTPQGIHKMMDTGRLRYVVAAGLRFPVRAALKERPDICKRSSSKYGKS